jgi:hypothetical protein
MITLHILAFHEKKTTMQTNSIAIPQIDTREYGRGNQKLTI